MKSHSNVEGPLCTGDCYLLLDCPAKGMATVGFAYQGEDPQQVNRSAWFLMLDDGDFDKFYELRQEYELLLIRRAHDGLAPLLPEKYRQSALRYEQDNFFEDDGGGENAD